MVWVKINLLPMQNLHDFHKKWTAFSSPKIVYIN